MEAWLEAYHYKAAGSHAIDFGHLDARAGAIQVSNHYHYHIRIVFTMIFLDLGCR